MRVTVALYILVYIRKHTNDFFLELFKRGDFRFMWSFCFCFWLTKTYIFKVRVIWCIFIFWCVLYNYMKSRLFWSKIYIIFLYYFVQVILIKSYLQCRKICWGSKNLYIFFCKDIPVYDERGDQQWGFYDLPQKL